MCNIGTATLMKGEEKRAIETAVLLIQMGKLTLEEIAAATKLPLETVQSLAEGKTPTE